MPQQRMSDAAKARRRKVQELKISRARKILGGILAVGAGFGVINFFRGERKRMEQNRLAQEWARQERLRTDAQFRARQQRLIQEDREFAQRMAENEAHFRAHVPENRQLPQILREAQEEYDAQILAGRQRQRERVPREHKISEPSEAEFVAQHQPPPIAQLPECYGVDAISGEEINFADAEQDAIAIIYARTNPLKAHCFQRGNFEPWWAQSNLYHSAKYANINGVNVHIFRLYHDHTYITKDSVDTLLTNPAKVFQLVLYKKLPGNIDLHVVIPVQVRNL